ncbi:MAG: hypothetical protein ACUVTX_05670 [Bacteroidales bacterium]
MITLVTAIILCAIQLLSGQEKEFSIALSGGIVKPFISVEPIGDDFFGAGTGEDWKQVIGLTSVGFSYWITGNMRFFPMKSILLEADMSYWRKTEQTNPSLLPDVKVDNIFRDFSIGLNAVYQLKGEKFTPFFGGGVQLHFLRAQVEPEGFPEISEKASLKKIGACLSGGIDIALNKKLSFFVASRYDYVPDWHLIKMYSGIRYHIH